MPDAPSIEKAVRLAEAQSGLPYIFAYEESATDPTPEAFDCSELIEYIDDRVGPGTMPDGSMNQLAYCQQRGTMISVEKALSVRGALLIRHASVLGVGHIAVSRGTKPPTSAEARGSAYGCGIFTADPKARLWTHAALWPGFDYHLKPAKPELVERWVVFGPNGVRWGHAAELEKVLPFIREFNKKFPNRPALVLRRKEPKDLDDIKPGDFPKWLAEKHDRKAA